MSEPTDFFVGIAFLGLLITFVLSYINVWHRKQQMKIESMIPQQSIDELKTQHAKEITALKERVATLEKIVTDGKFDLKREIEKLDAA